MGSSPSPSLKKKVIIDTDPGIDDAMAILMAFQSPELEIIGLTSVFGNVHATLATFNALFLCELGGHPHVPVAEGSGSPLKGGVPRIADFVHGDDGLGNTNLAKACNKKIEQSAVDFLIEKVSQYPGEISIVALGPLTNVAHAIKKNSSFGKNIGQLIVLGGAFFSSGNVSPAAEANIFGDPEAADFVFTSPGINTFVIGINLTTQVILTDEDLIEIKNSNGRHAEFLFNCTQFYKKWHIQSDRLHGIFLHDPTCMAAVLDPTLFTYRKGTVRVETSGICAGHTLLDLGLRKWKWGENPWTSLPAVNVGWRVNAEGVKRLVRDTLMRQ
ncbi:unnamed protein product [Calypogeia fissa]